MKEITLTVSSKGQVTLPKATRLRMGVKPGSKLVLSAAGSTKIVLAKKPALEDYYGKLDGFWGGEDPALEIRAWRDRQTNDQ